MRKQDPPGSGTYVALHDAMTADSVQSQFVGHWFHAGWMSHFPAGVGPASCSSGGEWNDLASYQAVLNSGRTLVIFWWFHDDQPCSSSHRADSINTCNDCLVPLLNNLTNGNVVVVLEPEYNNNTTGGLCGGNVIQKDPSWATHLNSLITAVQGAGGAGLNVRVGASPGDFDYANQAYDLNPSLAPAAAAGDFVAFHEIYRSNSGHALPGDTHFGNPSPDQVYHALSYSRFLKKRYSKPLMLGYWTVAPGNYGTAAQADALLDFFENRAQLEANDVELFGPFWYFDDTYPGEGLISSGNVQRPAHAVWRDEANAVISGVDRTQSIGFISPDFGDVLDADSSVNVQWISRGRPNTASTFSLYYQVGSGPVTLIASGLPGDDSSIMSYSWDACAIAPAVDVRLRLVSDLSTEAWSGTFDLTRSSATSNAHHKFDSGTEGWSGSAPDVWTTQGSPVVSAPGSAAFNGTGGLQVTYNHGLDGGWAHIGYEGVRSVSGGNKVTALVYVPFEMNPVTIPGAPVTQAQIHIQWNCGAWPTEDSGTIWLHEGWNEVVLNYTNPSGCGGIAHTEIRFWNKYPGLDGSSVFYVDEVRWGGDLTFSAPGCVAATPTPSFTVSPTPSASPSATPVYSPTHSPTQAPGTATPTPSASPSETPLPSCNAEWNFDDGTVQGWTAQTAALTGITASTAQPYQGSHSLAMTVDFVQPSQNEARMDVSTPSFPRDFTGETLSYWLYVPAGMSDAANPSGATLYVQTGAGWAWHESAWWNIPDSAGWYQISLDMTTVADPDMVQSVGVKVALGGTSPDWSGTIYVDEIGPNPICPTATSTPVGFSPTSTSTSTVSATPTATLTQTPVETLTATPTETTVSDTATATPSVTPADSETATPTSTPVDSLTATPTESPVLPTETVTATNTPQDSPTPTPMLTATATPSVTASFTDTPMVTSTATPSVTASFTESPIASDTASPTVTVTSTNSPISTETATPSPSATLGASFTATPTASVTLTVTPTVTPTATMTMTDTTVPTVMGTATASPTETPSATPSITPTFTPSGCTTWDFEDGLTAGWSRDTVFDTGVKTMAVNATAAYNGSYGLQLGLDLVPSTTDEGGVIYVNGTQNGFPRDYSDGRTLTAWIWVPAGMSQASTPSGAFIYAKTGSGWAWNQGSWTNLPDSAGWVQVSMSMTGVPDNDNVGEIGIKIGLGGGAPAWMGTVYVDDIDDNPAVCGVDTFTATPTSTATPTITFSPTQSPVYSPTMTPVVSATPTATLVSASPTHTPVSGSQGKLKPICIAVNPANPNLPLTVSVELTGVVESLRWRIYSKAHTRIGSGELSGPWGPGWHSVQLPSQPDLASGLYYYVLEGFNGQRSAGRTKAGKLYLLR